MTMKTYGPFKERYPELLAEWQYMSEGIVDLLVDRVHDRLEGRHADDEDYQPTEDQFSDALDEAWNEVEFAFQMKHALTDKQMEKILDAS